MSDYILARKSRNIMSSTLHVFLNLLLGIGSVAVTLLSGNPAIGLILVFVSKWRIFAVRPRYIWVGLKSNLVDIIVGCSIVLLTYCSGTALLPVDFILAIVYCVWLLFIKSMTSETAILIQSLVAVFLGTTAAVLLTSTYNSIVIALVEFVIGYAASRHILVQADDKHFVLTTLVCGLIFAEIAWLCQSWTIIYTFGASGIRLPQLSIILTIFAFVYNLARQAIVKYDNNFRFKDILLPVIFSAVLIAVIVIFFSEPIFNI